jgi:hypothetical protein
MKFLADLYLPGRCRGGTALATFASALTDDSWCENGPIFHGSTGISSLFMAKHGEHVAEMDQKKHKNTLTVFRVLTFGGARIVAPCAHCGGCILSSTRNKSCTEVAGAHFFDRPKPVSCRSFANPHLLPRLRRSVPGTERPPQGWDFFEFCGAS